MEDFILITEPNKCYHLECPMIRMPEKADSTAIKISLGASVCFLYTQWDVKRQTIFGVCLLPKV